MEVIAPIALALAAALAALFWWQVRAARAAWAQAAARLGLDFTSQDRDPMLKGVVEGLPVTVEVRRHGSAPGISDHHTRYAVEFEDLRLGLEVSRPTEQERTAAGRGERALAPEELTVTGSGPGGVATYLTTSRARALAALLEAYPDAEISDTEITCARPGMTRTTSEILSTVEVLIATARELASG